MNYNYDLIVIGAGSGGVRAARMAAKHGQNVAIIEGRFLGGTCVNVGCVPKKLMVHAAHGHEYMDLLRSFGWHGDNFTFNLATLKHHRDAEIARLNGVYERLLEQSGVTLFHGYGNLLPQDDNDIRDMLGRVHVGDDVLSAPKILIAPGSTPFIPDILGKEHIAVSDAIFDLTEVPKKTLIVGGGYIAIEMACILQNLGSNVTLSYRGGRLLKECDNASVEFLQQECAHSGLSYKFHDNVQSITKQNDSYIVTHGDNSDANYNFVLYATGRVPNIDGDILNQLSIEYDSKGFITVDDNFKTTNPVYYAVGDVINSPALTPVAIKEAMYFVARNIDNSNDVLYYGYVPTAIFSIPTYAYVGETAESLQKKNIIYDTYQASFKPLAHSLGGSEGRILMRLYVERDSNIVLGFHQVGGAADDIIQLAGACVNSRMTKTMLDSVIAIHPSVAEEWVTLSTPL